MMQVGGHVSYLTDSPIVTKTGLCNSLVPLRTVIYKQLTAIVSPLNNSLASIFLPYWGPRPTGWHFADDIFQCIFMIESCIFIQILLKFVPWGPTDDNSTLVQIMMRCGQVTGDIIYNNDGLIYICIYVSLSLNLLTVKMLIFGILAHWGLVTHVYVRGSWVIIG